MVLQLSLNQSNVWSSYINYEIDDTKTKNFSPELDMLYWIVVSIKAHYKV